MVMGHTVQRDGQIRTRCNGKAVLIDIGISWVYGGHVGALEIIGDQVNAIYEHGIEVLVPSSKSSSKSSSTNQKVGSSQKVFMHEEL